MGRCGSKCAISPRSYPSVEPPTLTVAAIIQGKWNKKHCDSFLIAHGHARNGDPLSCTISSPSEDAVPGSIIEYRPRLENIVPEHFTPLSEPELLPSGMVQVHVLPPVGVIAPKRTSELQGSTLRASQQGGNTMYIASKAASSLENCGILQAHRLLHNVLSPYITNLCHAFQDAHRVYLVVEDASGVTLDSILSIHKAGLPESLVNVVAASLVAALNDIHAQGCCHGAVLPSSVVIDSHGTVKLSNFFRSNTRAAPHDLLRDWHHLGVLLFRLLTGREPYVENGRAMKWLKFIRQAKPKKSIRGLPWIESILEGRKYCIGLQTHTVPSWMRGQYDLPSHLSPACRRYRLGALSGLEVAQHAWIYGACLENLRLNAIPGDLPATPQFTVVGNAFHRIEGLLPPSSFSRRHLPLWDLNNQRRLCLRRTSGFHTLAISSGGLSLEGSRRYSGGRAGIISREKDLQPRTSSGDTACATVHAKYAWAESFDSEATH